MAVPEDFERAYEMLVEFTQRLARAEVRDEVREEADAYLSEACRGSSVLAQSAILALRYELAREGMATRDDGVAADLKALGRIEEYLQHPPSGMEASGTESGGESPKIVEVALPEDLRKEAPEARGFKMGELQIVFQPIEGPPYGHMSVSHPDRYPRYDELLRARTAPGGEPPHLWALVPKEGGTPGMHPNVVHLYVMPPESLLG